MTASREELRKRISTALSEVSAAEAALETALQALGSGGPRAEKVAVTSVVSDAVAQLRRAHEDLSALRDLIDEA